MRARRHSSPLEARLHFECCLRQLCSLNFLRSSTSRRKKVSRFRRCKLQARVAATKAIGCSRDFATRARACAPSLPPHGKRQRKMRVYKKLDFTRLATRKTFKRVHALNTIRVADAARREKRAQTQITEFPFNKRQHTRAAPFISLMRERERLRKQTHVLLIAVGNQRPLQAHSRSHTEAPIANEIVDV